MSPDKHHWLATLTRLLTDVPLFAMFFVIHFGMRGDGDTSNALVNGALFTIFAAPHSILAREPLKQFIAHVVGEEAYVRIVYVNLSGITLAVVLIFWQPVSGEVWHATGVLFWLLSAAYLLSVLALIHVATYFDYAEFLGIKQFEQLAPPEEPATGPVLSVQGPYAYCRHPMYFALLAVFWIGPVMSYARLQFALLGTLYLFIGSRFEERNLRRELGEPYDLYCANVPMWFPRLTPWSYPE